MVRAYRVSCVEYCVVKKTQLRGRIRKDLDHEKILQILITVTLDTKNTSK